MQPWHERAALAADFGHRGLHHRARAGEHPAEFPQHEAGGVSGPVRGGLRGGQQGVRAGEGHGQDEGGVGGDRVQPHPLQRDRLVVVVVVAFSNKIEFN